MTQRKYELSVFITSKTNKISNFLLFCTLKKIDYSSNNFILSITFNLLLARFWLFCVSHLCWTACFSLLLENTFYLHLFMYVSLRSYSISILSCYPTIKMLLFFVSKNFHIILKSDRSTLQNSFYSELSCYHNLASYFYEIDKGHSS